jgi:hypothetical protein
VTMWPYFSMVRTLKILLSTSGGLIWVSSRALRSSTKHSSECTCH